MQTSGIRPDLAQATEQGDTTEQERKSVREVLKASYDTNIFTRLRTEICSADVTDYSHTKDGSSSKLVHLNYSLWPLYRAFDFLHVCLGGLTTCLKLAFLKFSFSE